MSMFGWFRKHEHDWRLLDVRFGPVTQETQYCETQPVYWYYECGCGCFSIGGIGGEDHARITGTFPAKMREQGSAFKADYLMKYTPDVKVSDATS